MPPVAVAIETAEDVFDLDLREVTEQQEDVHPMGLTEKFSFCMCTPGVV
ncbi:hypothetical protein AB0I49_02245 [Streptomyces sp. NPDC050617]